MSNGLTDKQRRFCEEYVVDCNACQAAKRAGLSERSAFRLIKEPEAIQYIKEMLDGVKSAKIADATEVMEYLTAVLRGEAKEEAVIAGDVGPTVVEVAPSTKNRLRAAELLGKRHRLFTDKVELEAAVPVVIYGSDELEE